MNTKQISIVIYILTVGLVSLLISSCGSEQIFVPTFTPIPTITLTPTFTLTLTPTSIPTATLTPSPTSTPIGGGLGQLVFGARHCKTWPSCDFSIYKYDLQSRQSSLLFKGFQLVGISPDGNKLLVSKVAQISPQTFELYITNLDGSNPILLHDNFDISMPKWLSKTDWIAFIAFESRKSQVFIIHPDGTGLTQVTHSTFGVIDILSVVNEGIYWEEGYKTDKGIYHRGYRWTKLDGSETKKFDNWQNATISSDGNYVAYINPLCFEMGGSCSITISKVDGSGVVTVSPEDLNLPLNKIFFFDVAWLPNNEDFIVEVYLCNSECETRYFLFSLSGKLLSELPPKVPWIPKFLGMDTWLWSPDERSFIFADYQKTDTGYRIHNMLYEMDTEQVKAIEFGLVPELDVYQIFWLPYTP